MKGLAGLVLAAAVFGWIAGCERPPKSGKGFAFPEGDAVRGKATFVEMKCHACHTVDREDGVPGPVVAPDLVIRLGGEVSKMRTYGDLVTSIIHPSYEISDKVARPLRWEMKVSTMPPVNDAMTVRQLLDVVTFLQPHYRELEPLYQGRYFTP